MRKFENPENGCGHKRFSLDAGTIYWQVFRNGALVGYITRTKGKPRLYEVFDIDDNSLGLHFTLFDARMYLFGVRNEQIEVLRKLILA